MNKLEATRQLIQLVAELSEFDITYQPKETIKVQSLVDYIVEFTPAHDQQNKDQGVKE